MPLNLNHLIGIVRMQDQPPLQIFLHVEPVPLVIVGCQPVVRVLCQVVFIREEWSHASYLHNALAAIHHCQLIQGHEVFATMSSEEFNNRYRNVQASEIFVSCDYC